MDIIKPPSTQPVNGPGRPLDTDKDAAILDAARQLLFTKGPRAFSMEAVARVAGVSKATLYSRHANRDQLLAAALELQARRLQQGLMQAPATQQDVSTSLFQFCINVLRFMASEEHSGFMRAMGASSELPENLRLALYQFGPAQMHADISRWLGSLHEARLLACPDPDFSAEMLLGMLQGLRLLRSMYRVSLDLAEEEAQRQAERISRAFIAMHAAGPG